MKLLSKKKLNNIIADASKPYWDDEHNFQAIPIDYIDEVIENMKAEVSEWKK